MKQTAMTTAHEVLEDLRDEGFAVGCYGLGCGHKGIDLHMHHVYGRKHKRHTGEILGVSLVALCEECHAAEHATGRKFYSLHHPDLTKRHIEKMIARNIKVYEE